MSIEYAGAVSRAMFFDDLLIQLKRDTTGTQTLLLAESCDLNISYIDKVIQYQHHSLGVVICMEHHSIELTCEQWADYLLMDRDLPPDLPNFIN